MKLLKQILCKTRDFAYITITIILIFQIVFSYYSLNKLSTDDFTSYAQQILQQQEQSDEQKNLNLSLIAASISSDYTISSNLLANYVDFNSLTTAASVIRKNMFFSQTLTNVYIYDSNKNRLYTSDAGTINKSGREDDDIWKCVDAYIASGAKNYISKRDSSYYHIYKFDNKSQNLIVFKESIPKMTKDYSNIQYNVKGNLIVADSDYNIIFGSNEYTIGDNLKNSNLIDLISKNKSISKIKQGEKSYYGIASFSETLNRHYILLVPTDIVIKNKVFSKDLALAYICIISSILVAFFIIYLLRNAKNLHKNKSRRDISLPTDNTLSEIISNHYNSSGKSDSLLPEYINNVVPKATEVAVVAVHFNGLEENGYSHSDATWIKHGINNILLEVFAPVCKNILLALDDDNTLEYIFCFQDSKKFAAEGYTTVQECQLLLSTYINLDYSFCVSNILPVRQVWECYKSIREASEYLYLHKENSILTAKDISSLSEDDFHLADSLCDEIKKQLLSFEDYTDSMDALFSLISKANPEQARELAYKVAFNVLYVLTMFNEKGITHAEIDSFAYVSKIENANKVHDVLNYVRKITNSAYGELSIKETNTEKLVANCIEIINQNYSDPNFSANTVAENMNFSTSYLNRKFKFLTGLSVSSQITEIRLKAAANELANTNNKISDVMLHSGFVNTSHFAMLFKKKYNMTPSAYRTQANKQK